MVESPAICAFVSKLQKIQNKQSVNAVKCREKVDFINIWFMGNNNSQKSIKSILNFP